MKHYYLPGTLLLAAGLLPGCQQDKYVLDIYSTMRYDVVALPLATDTMKLTTVDFISAREGFVGGVGGALFATTDGGQTWARRPSPTTGTINKLTFASATAGWAGTTTGLYRTTNGGQTWQSVATYDYYKGPMTNVLDVQLVTAQVGYAVGNNGGIYKTTNGGSTWVNQQARRDKSYTFQAVSFTSPDSGLVVGTEQARWRTVDGGRTWSFDDYYKGTYYDVLRYGRGAHLLGTSSGFEAYAPPNAAGGYDYPAKPDDDPVLPLYGLATAGPRGPLVGVGERTLVRYHPAYSLSSSPWVYVHQADGTSFGATYYAADFAEANTFYAVGARGVIHRFHYQ